MIISRDNGLLNDYFSIIKDQLINLYYFCTIEGSENDEPQKYPVKDNESGEIIYVLEDEIKNYKSGKIDIRDYIK